MWTLHPQPLHPAKPRRWPRWGGAALPAGLLPGTCHGSPGMQAVQSHLPEVTRHGRAQSEPFPGFSGEGVRRGLGSPMPPFRHGLWSVTLWSYRAAACPLLSPTGHVAPDSPCLLGVSPFKVTPPPILPLPPRQRVWACVCVAGWSSQGPGPTGKACETHALYRASWAVPRGPDTGSVALSPV